MYDEDLSVHFLSHKHGRKYYQPWHTAECETKVQRDRERSQGHRMSQLGRNPRTRSVPLQRRLQRHVCHRARCVPSPFPLRPSGAFFLGAQQVPNTHYLLHSLRATVAEGRCRHVCLLSSNRQTKVHKESKAVYLILCNMC